MRSRRAQLLLRPGSNLLGTILLSSILISFSQADWIDPDTPLEAYSTEPHPPVVPNLKAKTKDDSSPSSTKKKKKVVRETPAPTDAPTATLRPSTSPSESPSAYPTATPGKFHLVFSDEFNTPGRTFEDGNDPRWTALEKNDYTNDALHYYSNQNAVVDNDGNLVIRTEASDTDVLGFDDVKRKNTRVTKHFKSAMLQTWNKFCFTGGIIEASVELPGKANVGGLWPAFWILGNLARHTYVGSSQHIWPWSSTKCTQKSFYAQKLSGCDEVAHYGMARRIGRGAPEIDIFEVQPGNVKANTGPFLESPVGQPFMSASFQVAPGRTTRAGDGYWPGPGQWYEGLKGGNESVLNINFYGNYNHFRGDPHPEKSDYWSDAISYNRQLHNEHFEGSHIYRLEWDVPRNGTLGYLRWFLDGELVLDINGTTLKNAGEGAEISSEPSYILLNTAVSSQWGFPKECPDNCPCKDYDCNSHDYKSKCGFSEGFCDMMRSSDPPKYKVDWVRVYQDPNDDLQKVGCSTPERPTRRWIEAHADQYKQEHDLVPLKGVQRGRGRCDPRAVGVSRDSCGGHERGECTEGKVCECKPGWTGPHCLSAVGTDPILYDIPDKITDVGFEPPKAVPVHLFIGFIASLVIMVVAVKIKKARDEGWMPIPDVGPDSRKMAMRNGKHHVRRFTTS